MVLDCTYFFSEPPRGSVVKGKIFVTPLRGPRCKKKETNDHEKLMK